METIDRYRTPTNNYVVADDIDNEIRENRRQYGVLDVSFYAIGGRGKARNVKLVKELINNIGLTISIANYGSVQKIMRIMLTIKNSESKNLYRQNNYKIDAGMTIQEDIYPPVNLFRRLKSGVYYIKLTINGEPVYKTVINLYGITRE